LREEGENLQSKAQHSGKSCAKMRIFSAIFCRILQNAAFFLQFSANFCSFLHPLARMIDAGTAVNQSLVARESLFENKK